MSVITKQYPLTTAFCLPFPPTHDPPSYDF